MEMYIVLILIIAALICMVAPGLIWYINIAGTFTAIKRLLAGKLFRQEILTCSIDADCPPGHVCMGGRCILQRN